MMVFVGIDIAAKSFDLVVRTGGQNSKAEQFSQSTHGHDSAIKRMRKAKPLPIVAVQKLKNVSPTAAASDTWAADDVRQDTLLIAGVN